MDKVANVSPAQSILLAASLASDANVRAFHELIKIKADLFDVELTCRIILTFLPESLDPSSYLDLLHYVASPNGHDDLDDISIDTGAIEELSESDARQQLKWLRLLPLRHPSISRNIDCDDFSLFLIHRTHRIDSETGLLPLAPKLITPFVHRSDYLRDWYVGNCVPLLRLDYDYYPDDESSSNLDAFQDLEGAQAVTILLSKSKQSAIDGHSTPDTVGRDFRGILGPFAKAKHVMRGRKRKRDDPEGFTQESHRIQHTSPQEWQDANKWLLSAASDNFTLVVEAFKGWSGPNDVDLGLPEELYDAYQTSPEVSDALTKRFCQTAFASIYAVDRDTSEAIHGAHSLLISVARMLHFTPPPDLTTSVHMFPQLENRPTSLNSDLIAALQGDALLQENNPLTIANFEQFSLLEVLLQSAYLLISLGHPMSAVKVAKLRFSGEDGEQLRLVQRILHGLVHAQKKGHQQWQDVRDTMLWLWDWALSERSGLSDHGYGLFGKIKRATLEVELLKALCAAGQYNLVSQIYLNKSATEDPLPREQVEKVIVSLALHYYDNASNGNKTRGGVKKALDILTAFRNDFAHSRTFKRCNHLIAATHALSFYSLKLQPGVPFQPSVIRTMEDPLYLIEKVLEQNANAYTKLDDLIEIGCNLIKAYYSQHEDQQGLVNSSSSPSEFDEATDLLIAERRVISAAIESALKSNDFETAYSYVVNRLQSPISNSDATSAAPIPVDDVSWRAALLAGRYRSPPESAPRTSTGATPPHIRGVEQRMELLSHALQLAPAPNLPEVLASWRRVEEELLTVLAQEAEAEQEFDDQAEKGAHRTTPGSFDVISRKDSRNPLGTQQRQRELGRGAPTEAPMGLFDVARGAAAAFSRSTSGSFSGPKSSGNTAGASPGAADISGRPRKRDMVANAVTGGLASGLGWVLGATPASRDENS